MEAKLKQPSVPSEKKLSQSVSNITVGSKVTWEEGRGKNDKKRCHGEVILVHSAKKVHVRKEKKKMTTVQFEDFDLKSIILPGRQYFCTVEGTKTLCTVEQRVENGYKVSWMSKGGNVFKTKAQLEVVEEKNQTPDREVKKRKRLEPASVPVQRKRLKQATPVMNSTPIGGSKLRQFLTTPTGRTGQFATPTPKRTPSPSKFGSPKTITPLVGSKNMTPMAKQFHILTADNARLKKEEERLKKELQKKDSLWKQKVEFTKKSYQKTDEQRKKDLEEISSLYERKEKALSSEFTSKLENVESQRRELVTRLEEQEAALESMKRDFEMRASEQSTQYEDLNKKLMRLQKEKEQLVQEKRSLTEANLNLEKEKSGMKIEMPLEIPQERLGKYDSSSVIYRMRHIRYYEEILRWVDQDLSKAAYARNNGLKPAAFRSWFKNSSEDNMIKDHEKQIEMKGKEIFLLNAEMANCKELSTKQTSLLEQVKTEKEKIRSELESLKQKKADDIASLKKEVKELKSEARNAAKQIKDAESAKSKSAKEIEEWKTKLNNVETEKQKAVESLNLINEECANLKKANTKRKNVIEKMRVEYDSQKTELDADRKKLWDVQNQLDLKNQELEQTRNELQTQAGIRENLQKSLQNEVLGAQNSKSELATLKTEFERLTEQNQQHVSKSEEIQKRLDRILLKDVDSMTQKDLRELRDTFTTLSFEAMQALKKKQNGRK